MGLRVDTASSAEEGLTLAATVRPDILILDVRLPGMDGLDAMRLFRQHIGDAPIIVMTAFGELDVAVKAVDLRAFEYIVKPFDLAEIRAAVERAVASRQRDRVVPARPDSTVGEMIGHTPAMHAVFKRIALAAKADASVLICGESGVGKETAARAIHRHSPRGDRPFVTASASDLLDYSAESEALGPLANAPQGPAKSSGLLGRAEGGTLFIDDVADLPMPMQMKLLRAIERREASSMGAGPWLADNIRLICATTQDLQERVSANEFRHDLFLRLATFEIEIPPLRDRREDIPSLVQLFKGRSGRDGVSFVPETLEELAQRPWHGNVRELQRAVTHALVVARSGPVLPCHLPEPLPLPAATLHESSAEGPLVLDHAMIALAHTLLEDPANAGDVHAKFLQEVEPPLLATALHRHGNRCAPAARALGLHRTTLRRKLIQYGIEEGLNDR
jgi:two-component system nitrogen regulation response regulator GlnG